MDAAGVSPGTHKLEVLLLYSKGGSATSVTGEVSFEVTS